jgi:uncharacterized protein (DUF433 family)
MSIGRSRSQGIRNQVARDKEIHSTFVVEQDKEARGERSLFMSWQDRISVNPGVGHGKPCIKGKRVLVSAVLAGVAAGDPFESIMNGYYITREDIQAALLFAADLAQDLYVWLPEIG